MCKSKIVILVSLWETWPVSSLIYITYNTVCLTKYPLSPFYPIDIEKKFVRQIWVIKQETQWNKNFLQTQDLSCYTDKLCLIDEAYWWNDRFSQQRNMLSASMFICINTPILLGDQLGNQNLNMHNHWDDDDKFQSTNKHHDWYAFMNNMGTWP